MENQKYQNQQRKTIHVSWNEAQRAEMERENIRRARYKPVAVPNLFQAIAARLSRDLPKLKATALRLVNTKNH